MRRFSLPQLEALLWISRLGSFRAAAEKLNVTQPTISLRIRELEGVLGARLFERRGSSFRLTVPGSVLLQYSERGFELFDEMEERLRTQDPLRGSLRLGSADTFAMTSLPAIIKRVETLYPRLKLELFVDHSVALSGRLADRKLDIAFLNNPEPIRHIVIERLGALEVAWVGSPSQRIAKRVLRPADLVQTSVLAPPRSSPLDSIVTSWFARAGCRLPSISTCNNISVIARLVASGVGMSVLPVNFIDKELQSGMLVRYRELPAFEPLTLCAAHQERAEGPGIAAVVNTARDVIRQAGFFYRLT